MIQETSILLHCRDVAENIHVMAFQSPGIAREVKAGQFLNIRVEDTTDPLLRRPFSVYNTDGGNVLEIIYNVIGKGTAALSRKKPGETIDVLGPLGVGFSADEPSFSTGVLIAGGLGVAPMPLLTRALRSAGKDVITLLGSRNAASVVGAHLENVHTATDDGTAGFRGTVVELARQVLAAERRERMKLFACGPTAMLRAVAQLARETGLPCEVSLEGPMACGFGICQGCPVELAEGPRKYALMCKDGPIFDVRKIKL